SFLFSSRRRHTSFSRDWSSDVCSSDLAAVIEREPIDVIDPETRGLLASIGIRKDTPFAPDARMRSILADAAGVANGTARAIAFQIGRASCRERAPLPVVGL